MTRCLTQLVEAFSAAHSSMDGVWSGSCCKGYMPNTTVPEALKAVKLSSEEQKVTLID